MIIIIIVINMLQTWQSDLSLSQKSERKKGIKRNKWGEKNWQWLRERLEPANWQMACHALTNWATESTQWLNSSTKGWAARDPAEADTKLACSMGRVRRARSARRMTLTCTLQTWQSDLSLVTPQNATGRTCVNKIMQYTQARGSFGNPQFLNITVHLPHE